MLLFIVFILFAYNFYKFSYKSPPNYNLFQKIGYIILWSLVTTIIVIIGFPIYALLELYDLAIKLILDLIDFLENGIIIKS